MSEVKNTPGPWRTHISDGRGHLCVISDDAWICGEIHRPGGGMPRAEAEANASLIAAAPDMLSALNAAIDFGEDGKRLIAAQGGDLIVRLPDNVVSLIRGAIAKAEGRAP